MTIRSTRRFSRFRKNLRDRKSTRLNSSHSQISYAVFCLKKKMRHDFVDRLGLLTDRQLLDAVAIGQFTPCPGFTTATFLGYILRSCLGSLLAFIDTLLPQ